MHQVLVMILGQVTHQAQVMPHQQGLAMPHQQGLAMPRHQGLVMPHQQDLGTAVSCWDQGLWV
jgi:hypothetical protein